MIDKWVTFFLLLCSAPPARSSLAAIGWRRALWIRSVPSKALNLCDRGRGGVCGFPHGIFRFNERKNMIFLNWVFNLCGRKATLNSDLVSTARRGPTVSKILDLTAGELIYVLDPVKHIGSNFCTVASIVQNHTWFPLAWLLRLQWIRDLFNNKPQSCPVYKCCRLWSQFSRKPAPKMKIRAKT